MHFFCSSLCVTMSNQKFFQLICISFCCVQVLVLFSFVNGHTQSIMGCAGHSSFATIFFLSTIIKAFIVWISNPKYAKWRNKIKQWKSKKIHTYKTGKCYVVFFYAAILVFDTNKGCIMSYCYCCLNNAAKCC